VNDSLERVPHFTPVVSTPVVFPFYRSYDVLRQSSAACKALKVLKTTVLKRLASAVQLRPWPPNIPGPARTHRGIPAARAGSSRHCPAISPPSERPQASATSGKRTLRSRSCLSRSCCSVWQWDWCRASMIATVVYPDKARVQSLVAPNATFTCGLSRYLSSHTPVPMASTTSAAFSK